MMPLRLNEFYLQIQIQVCARGGAGGRVGVLRRVKARLPAHDQVDLALGQAQSGLAGSLTWMTSGGDGWSSLSN